MVPSRVENPGAEQLLRVEERLRAGESLIVQFSDSRHYTAELLRRVDSLCADSGERLEVRFYGHGTATFDCRTLAEIPRVANHDQDNNTRCRSRQKRLLFAAAWNPTSKSWSS